MKKKDKKCKKSVDLFKKIYLIKYMKSWKRKVVWMSLPEPRLDWETFKRVCSHLSVEDAKERAVVVMERIQRKKS